MMKDYAVQPAAWISFDEVGCAWATDLDHAARLAKAFGEHCIVWVCPHSGRPYPHSYAN